MGKKTPADWELDELVAALREAGDMMRQTATRPDVWFTVDEAADAIEALRAEVGR